MSENMKRQENFQENSSTCIKKAKQEQEPYLEVTDKNEMEDIVEFNDDQSESMTRFQWVGKVKWKIFRLDRMERLLNGELLDATVQQEWFDVPEEAQKHLCGAEGESEEWRQLMNNWIVERHSEIIDMFEEENKIIDLMRRSQIFPSDPTCAELSIDLRQWRQKLEDAFNDWDLGLRLSLILTIND